MNMKLKNKGICGGEKMFSEKLLFISHAEKDSELTEKFVDLLYDMGVPEKDMFCSSISEIGVPIKEDIYEYLRNLLDSEQVIPIFMLSDNYYASAACLNEMGAVWMKQNDYFTFLLPDFEFYKIKGAINPRKRGISLWYKSDRELQNLKEDLNQFREQIVNILGIEKYKNWERKRDNFIAQIQKLKMDMDTLDINLEMCEGFCIGEYEHSGCAVKFDNVKNKVSSLIDFTKTEAEICSIVIYVGELDVSYLYKNGKTISFDLKAADTICNVEVECKLKNRNVCKTVVTSSDWENYSILLSEFGGDISEWESLKEIKFLLKRKETSGGRIEIKNMKIK